MIIKKIFKLIKKVKKKPLNSKQSNIYYAGTKSTLIGRQKVELLKEIGFRKRNK